MAFIQCNFWSHSLEIQCSMNVILPQEIHSPFGVVNPKKEKYPTLYLLHGLSDDHTIFMRRTNIERYVSEMNMAVVMPAVNRSFYTDMHRGPKYWTFISQELPEIAKSFFPLSDKREDNFAAGISMGAMELLNWCCHVLTSSQQVPACLAHWI